MSRGLWGSRQFGSPPLRAQGMDQPGPWGHLRNQILLGSETFVEQMRRQLPQERDLSEIPRAQRRLPAKPLSEYPRLHPDRDAAITAAYASGGLRWEKLASTSDYTTRGSVESFAEQNKQKTRPDTVPGHRSCVPAKKSDSWPTPPRRATFSHDRQLRRLVNKATGIP